jgi:NAD(P)H-hydrate epimerase
MYKMPMFLYNTETVYQMDRAAVETDGLAEIELMRRAGQRVWQEISTRWPELSLITVFAGSGNNGGDAYVVALAARTQGVEVQFISKGDLGNQSDTSIHFRELWQQAGCEIAAWNQQKILGEVIVDGLLGIGLTRELDKDWQSLIHAINQSPADRVAIDIPSGLNANTGMPQPCAVNANLTVTFIGIKTGQYLADGPDYRGELVFYDLGVSSRVSEDLTPTLVVLDRDNIKLPEKRKRNSHKNNFGHLLIVGGDNGMAGAASLAALAALRTGAGLVTVLVHPECAHSLSAVSELMVLGWDSIDEKLEQATVILVGPGLGASKAAKDCLKKIQGCNKPIVVDASALDAGFLRTLASDQVVITPHPGEAAGLLSTSTSEIQSNRLRASQQLVDAFGVVSVLKGSGSIIQQVESIPAINITGNPGMASAGMGDVLAGMIAALMGQSLTPFEAAKTAVLIHALGAEEYASDNDETGLIASDIVQRIPQVIKQLREG